MQIINLRKASFVPRFHKHWLHFFYSFSKIMLLLKDNEHIRNGHVKVSTYQKGPQERKCSRVVTTDFPDTVCSSLAKQRKRWKQKHTILTTLTAIPCSWCNSDIMQTGDPFLFFLTCKFPTATSQRPTLQYGTSVPALTLKEEEHLKQNCSTKSHEGHSSHEHSSYKSYSCNSYKLKIKINAHTGVCPPQRVGTLRPTIVWRLNKEKSGEIK